MACKLCGGPGPLRKSHIMSEAAYVPLYDAKHRAVAPNLRQASVPFVQKGLYEKLLCEICEQRFSRRERYFFGIWQPDKLFPPPITQPHFKVTGFDYKRVKLFHLSVLWRAGVAKSYAFAQVNLGPHEPRLRDLLLNETCPSELIYPIFGCVLRESDSRAVLKAAVMPPASKRIHGVRTYVTAFAGCAWYYVVSIQAPPFPLSLVLKQEGTLYLPVINDLDFPPIINFVNAHRKLERLGQRRQTPRGENDG